MNAEIGKALVCGRLRGHDHGLAILLRAAEPLARCVLESSQVIQPLILLNLIEKPSDLGLFEATHFSLPNSPLFKLCGKIDDKNALPGAYFCRSCNFVACRFIT